jgi:hypothetical protein
MNDEPESGGLAPRWRGRFFLIPMLIIVAIMLCLIVLILIRTAWRAISG